MRTSNRKEGERAVDAPFAEVVELIRRFRDSGLIARSFAQSLESACWLIGNVADPGQATVRVVAEHLDQLVQRYRAIHPTTSEATLRSYRKRVEIALRYFEHHRSDPEWRPQRRAQIRHNLDSLRRSAAPTMALEQGRLTIPLHVVDAIQRGLPASIQISGRTVRLVPEPNATAGGLAGALRAYAKGTPEANVREQVMKEVAIAAASEGRRR